MNILEEVGKMSAEEQMAMASAIQKAASDRLQQSRSDNLGKSVEVVVQGLKKIKSDLETRFDELNNVMQTKVGAIVKGRDGEPGRDGKDGQDGRIGVDGIQGPSGVSGEDGKDGEDGISVVNAFVDFDGGLTIVLSDGREINAGEVIPMDVAEKIKVITNGGGTSQSVLDSIASLQSQIDTLIPSQTGNNGKYLTTNGTTTSWASVSGGGSVTSTSVVSANGFAGTVANATTTPAITVSTSITGVLKGNGTAISAATSGTDYSAGTSALATGILKSTTTTGTLSIAVAGDFPTLNQNTTGSAATLTTTRAIYGNNFDGSAALTQVIASTYGGTGNGFAKFSGPATAEKTFTLPNATATILTDNAAVTILQGGTGQTTASAAFNALSPITTAGDLILGNGANTTTRLAIGANGYVLTSNGTTATWAANSGGSGITTGKSIAMAMIFGF
jgi:hypothetical protein